MADERSLEFTPKANRPADRSTAYIFAYGSLLSPDLMRRVCPSATMVIRAGLPNYEVQFRVPSDTGLGGISGIVESPGKLVRGVVYQVAVSEVEELDALEGVDTGVYRKDRMLVLGEDREWYQADLYRPTDPGEIQIDPAPFYLDHMIEGALAHGMDRELISRLRNWRTSLG